MDNVKENTSPVEEKEVVSNDDTGVTDTKSVETSEVSVEPSDSMETTNITSDDVYKSEDDTEEYEEADTPEKTFSTDKENDDDKIFSDEEDSVSDDGYGSAYDFFDKALESSDVEVETSEDGTAKVVEDIVEEQPSTNETAKEKVTKKKPSKKEVSNVETISIETTADEQLPSTKLGKNSNLKEADIDDELSDLDELNSSNSKETLRTIERNFYHRKIRNLPFRDEEGKLKKAYEFTKTETFLDESHRQLRRITGIIARAVKFDNGTPYAEVHYNVNGIEGSVYIRVDDMGFHYKEKAKAMLKENLKPNMEGSQVLNLQRKILNELNRKYTTYINNLVGAEIDFLVKDVDTNNLVYGDRREAMLLSRRLNYFPIFNGPARIEEGGVTTARILTVFAQTVILDIHGIIKRVHSNRLTRKPCSNLNELFNQNDKIEVVITALEGVEGVNVNGKNFAEESDKISFNVESVASLREYDEIYEKSKTYASRQVATAEVVGIRENGALNLVFADGVPAICTNYNRNPMPQPRDKVVVTVNEIIRVPSAKQVMVYCTIQRITYRYSNNPNEIRR